MPKDKTNTKKTGGKPKKKDAGAKLSKAFRNFGPIKELMNSNLGREILADVIIAAAGAAAVALTKNRSGRKAGVAVSNASSVAADATREAVQTAAGAVAGAVTDAARHFLPKSLLAEDNKPVAVARKKPASRSATRKPKAASTASAPKKPRAPRKARRRPPKSAPEGLRSLNGSALGASARSCKILADAAPFTLLAENGRLPGQALLEHFRAKRLPVRVKKMR